MRVAFLAGAVLISAAIAIPKQHCKGAPARMEGASNMDVSTVKSWFSSENCLLVSDPWNQKAMAKDSSTEPATLRTKPTAQGSWGDWLSLIHISEPTRQAEIS